MSLRAIPVLNVVIHQHSEIKTVCKPALVLYFSRGAGIFTNPVCLYPWVIQTSPVVGSNSFYQWDFDGMVVRNPAAKHELLDSSASFCDCLKLLS